MHYPGDYGFIPSTLSDDGDPLDVLVLVPSPSFPGCVQEVRPIGLLEMLDQGVLDEKVLAVGKNNPRYTNVWNYTDIYPHMLKEITHFFSIYKDLEGKRVEMKGWRDAAYARDRVVHAIKQFKDGKGEAARDEEEGRGCEQEQGIGNRESRTGNVRHWSAPDVSRSGDCERTARAMSATVGCCCWLLARRRASGSGEPVERGAEQRYGGGEEQRGDVGERRSDRRAFRCARRRAHRR